MGLRVERRGSDRCGLGAVLSTAAFAVSFLCFSKFFLFRGKNHWTSFSSSRAFSTSLEQTDEVESLLSGS